MRHEHSFTTDDDGAVYPCSCGLKYSERDSVDMARKLYRSLCRRLAENGGIMPKRIYPNPEDMIVKIIAETLRRYAGER
jgi:hypothetical protein